MQVQDERILQINSAYRSAKGDNTANFRILYGKASVSNAVYAHPRMCQVPNMFPNVYGMSTMLYTSAGTLTIPEGRYTSTTLASTLSQASITENKSSGGVFPIFSVQVNTDGTFTFLVAASYFMFFYGTKDISTRVSLNEIMGCGFFGSPLVGFSNPFTCPEPPALFGPQRIYVCSDRITAGTCCRASGLDNSVLLSMSLVGVPFGSYANFDIQQMGLYTKWYTDTAELSVIDIRLLDMYDQVLTLPSNAHVDMEVVFGLITGA